jgi:hypothetical protein
MTMTMPNNSSAYLWGAFVGAVALAIVGFTWLGWVTGGTATRNSAAAAQEAVVAALAPICVEQFRGQADAPARIAALATTSSWERGSVVEKSGFATMPGSKLADSNVARACAELLAAAVAPAKKT